MLSILVKLRPLRVALIIMAILSLIFKAKIGAIVVYDGWPMIKTIFIPVMAPLITMVLLLDSLMATIWITQTSGAEKSRYKLILWCDLITAVIMLSIWIPYFMSILV